MELFFFDRNVLDSLPKEEKCKYQDALRRVIIPRGRPFFLDESGLPTQELEGFCNYLLNPGRASAKTWATYAGQILVFLRFMARQGKDWKQASREDLSLYYTVRTVGEFQTSPKLKARSWNVAKAAIVHLYEYALDDGLIDTLPFKYRKSNAAFGGRAVMTADLGAKFTPEPINFINLDHYKNIWRPSLTARRNSQRNLALSDLLISVGLRISEALKLQIHQIPDPDDKAHAGRKSVSVRVVGKGNKSRKVRISKRIVRAINFYIDEDREDAISQFRRRNGSKATEPQEVFLTEQGSPLKARSVQDLFKIISNATGLRLTPHGCRHTFAIYQLEAMIKRMATNLKELKEKGPDAYRQILSDPMRELQRLLGHSHIASTYIYLDFLEESEALVDESFADWVNWENENGR